MAASGGAQPSTSTYTLDIAHPLNSRHSSGVFWDTEDSVPESQGLQDSLGQVILPDGIHHVESTASLDTSDCLQPHVSRTLRDLKNLDNYLESLKERASQRLGEFRYERKLMSQKRSNVVEELQEEIERLTLENREMRQRPDCHCIGHEGTLRPGDAQKFLENVARLEAEKGHLVELVGERDIIIGDLERETAEARRHAASTLSGALELDIKSEQLQQLQDSLLAEKLATAALEQEKAYAEEQVVAMRQHIERQKGWEVDKRQELEKALREQAEVVNQLRSRLAGQPESPGSGSDAWGAEGDVSTGAEVSLRAQLADLRRQLQVKDEQLMEAQVAEHELEGKHRRAIMDKAARCTWVCRPPVMQASVAPKEEVELLKDRIAALAARKLLSGKHPRGQPGRGPAALEQLNGAYEEMAGIYDIQDEIMSELNALREEIFNPQSMGRMAKLVHDREVASRQNAT